MPDYLRNNKISRSRVICWVLWFVLVFSVLAFGTVETWSYAIMESLCLIALLLFFLRTASLKEPVFYNVPGLIPLLWLLAYILFQLIPLPASVVGLISPARYQIQNETVGAFEKLNWISLTINKKATLMEFFRMAAYAAFYVVTVQLLTKKELLKKTITVVVFFASFLSFFGILQYILSNNKIYWIRELTKGGAPFGPYVNHNHYAGLMGMLFPVVLSMFLYYKPKITYNSLRERVIEFFDQHKTNIHIVLGFFTVLIATSIFLSISRGAIISLSLSMGLFGILLRFSPLKRKRGVIIILILFLILLFVGWFGWEPVFEKFVSLRSAEGNLVDYRINIFRDSRNIMDDFVVSGSGFGSFSDIYRRYRTIQSDNFIDHAHNDYIELITDGGIISFLLVAWFLADVFIRSYLSFSRRNNTYNLYLFIGSATGMMYMLIHSITDFNMHIGANGLFFFFLAGLVVSSANTKFRDDHQKTDLMKQKIPLKLISILTGIIFFACVLFNLGIIIGTGYFSSLKGLNSEGDLDLAGDRVKTASLFDPFEPKYHYVIGIMEMRKPDMEQAAVQAEKAVKLSPVNGEYLQQLGLINSELQKIEIADKLLQAGINYDISDPLRYRVYASWLLAQGEKEKGIGYIKNGISMEPDKARTYIALMVFHKLSDEEIKSALPELARPYLQFADYLEKTGNEKMAVDAYKKASDLLETETAPNISYFYEIFRYYMKKNLYEDALNIMKKGIAFFSEDAGLRIAVADLYEKQGNKEKAIDEYRKALLIDKRNEQAKIKLEKLQTTNK